MAELWQSAALFSEQVWAVVKSVHFTDLLDILFVALLIYGLLRLIRETRGVQLLKGLFWLLLAWGAVQLLHMNASIAIFREGVKSLPVLLVVLFQPELRSMFERVGRGSSSLRLFPNRQEEAERKAVTRAIKQCCAAFKLFSAERTGALVVFERVTMLGEIIKTGTVLEARISRELLGNVFSRNAPLHDGAAIVRKGKLWAAGCVLPLTQSKDLDPALGTRHRAAIGMSEESDAMVVAVSEETGAISLAYKGTLTRNLTPAALDRQLQEVLLAQEDRKPLGLFGKKKGGAK